MIEDASSDRDRSLHGHIVPSDKLPPLTAIVANEPSLVIGNDAEAHEAAKEEHFLFKMFKRAWTESNAKIANLYIDIVLRVLMAGLLYLLTWNWLHDVVAILQDQMAAKAKLSDAVLIALLSTTTVNVLGILLAVALYLFPRKKDLEKTAREVEEIKSS